MTERAGVRIAEAVAQARASAGYYSGKIGPAGRRVDVDVDLDLDLLRVVLGPAGALRFFEVRLVPEPMPRGGVRYKAVCEACGERTFRLFVSDDRRHVVCRGCARLRLASRSLSNERRAAWIAAKLLARFAASSIDLVDPDAALHVPLAVRARFERTVGRFRKGHQAREARVRRTTQRLAARSSEDFAELHRELRLLIDDRVAREEKFGYDPGLGRMFRAAAGLVEASAHLRARTLPSYWRREVGEAARRNPAPGPAASRCFPSLPALDGPDTPPNPSSMSLQIVAAEIEPNIRSGSD